MTSATKKMPTVYYFPRATITNYHKLGGLKQHNLFLIVLDARSLKSRCRQALLSLASLRNSPSSSSLASPASCQSLVSLACKCITPVRWLSPPCVSSHNLSSAPVRLCPNFPFCQDTHHFTLGPTLTTSL